MGKSFRKTKIFGHCKGSEKQDKRKANRMFRRLTRILLQSQDDPILPVNLNEISDIRGFNKDGKRYLRNATERDMRK